MNILGISGYYHDAAAAIICDNKVLAAVQEERFTRIKHDASFPARSIAYCLQQAGLTLNELDVIVFYDKPFLKFERLLETYYRHAPKGFRSFVKAMPVWLKEKIFLKKLLKTELKKIDENFNTSKVKYLFTEHHLAHAASAFYASPFEKAAILTIDGVGEWATASIGKGEYNIITVLNELQFPDSVGLLYSSFTYFLGFRVNGGEYKLMGLAPYGNAAAVQTKHFIDIIENKLVKIFENGSIELDQQYFNYSTGMEMVKPEAWEKLFAVKIRKPEDIVTISHCNLALAIQLVTEKIVMLMAKHTKEITGSENLCLAGGVALNCVANGKLQKAGLFKHIFIQPAAGDAGGALGAALAVNYIYFDNPRKNIGTGIDLMQNAFLGPGVQDSDIQQAIQKFKAVYTLYPASSERNEVIVQLLQQSKVIGLFNGRMEFGPRALGNRSIIASAKDPGMQQQINLKIKFRESFRPFAAVTTEEDVQNYFDHNGASAYMLLVQPVKQNLLHALPGGYADWEPLQKLAFQRSIFPAVTHVDGTCRIQTCNQNENTALWQLLQAYKKATGDALLVNTSFNVRGEPIVCTALEAYTGFMNTGMDVLVMNNYIFLKEEQPLWTSELKQHTFAGMD